MRGSLSSLCLVVLAVVSSLAVPTYAEIASIPYAYNVYIDTDNNPNTGCGAHVHDANIPSGTDVFGFEKILEISVETTGSNATVTGLRIGTCTSGFGYDTAPAFDLSGWPVGLDVGVPVPSSNPADVIEAYISRAALGNPSAIRVVVTADRDLCSDVLLTTNGMDTGSPLIVQLSGLAAPALSGAVLGLLAVLLITVAVVLLRRRPLQRAWVAGFVGLLAVAGVAWAATIVMDGAVADWTGVSVLGNDVVNDSSADDDGEDIVAVFATSDSNKVYFRIDVNNLANLPP